ncbi:hypothetical protein WN55_05406 [Dufourea novaeangliae]|uniref:C2H2-type domain-containing protein n=2 Tax=Dufourea novaeangliae TaxID=178035 RepID=A0A154P0K1_DUFNO|nr:hypothetical protein WN55_05406 [Dufourea novaeangliae]
MCKICGKYFKCETDMNVHVAWKHNEDSTTSAVVTKETQDNSEACQVFTNSSCNYTNKSPGTKLPDKLRLILRIGNEIVTDTTVKRKHLKLHKSTNTATQTEPAGPAELIVENCSDKSIDHSVSGNSPCQCCVATMHVANSSNQYLADYIVANNATEYEESKGREESASVDGLTESFQTSMCEKENAIRDGLPDSIPLKSDVTIIENNSTEHTDTKTLFSHKNINSTQPSPNVNTLSVPSDISKPNMGTTKIADNTSETVQSSSKNTDKNYKQKGSPSERQSAKVTSTVKLIMPVIFPIIMPNNVISPTKTMEHRCSTPPQQQQQQEHTRVSTVENQNSDDEVQEVLRIVRGSSSTEDINQESPNRYEQEMLARDAIRDMLRMEQLGWHLLETENVELKKKRKRTGGKFDVRSSVADMTAKKRTKVAGSDNNNTTVRNMMNGRGVSNVSKELFAKVQKPCCDKVLPVPENAKENLLVCNGNISILPETLLRYYGISYYNEVFEINNNMETTVQGPVSRLLVSCSGIAENKSNKPTVIDLVNDTDE